LSLIGLKLIKSMINLHESARVISYNALVSLQIFFYFAAL
jgi:hypothetical protein